MTGDQEKEAQIADAAVEALMGFIDDAEPKEIEELAGAGGSNSAAVIASAREKLATIRQKVAAQRREALHQRMASASAISTPDVSAMTVAELKAVFAAHIANDQASSTMAARHEKGEMDEAELRSVVADILRLRLMK